MSANSQRPTFTNLSRDTAETLERYPIEWHRSDPTSPRPRAAAYAAKACVALERRSSLRSNDDRKNSSPRPRAAAYAAKACVALERSSSLRSKDDWKML